MSGITFCTPETVTMCVFASASLCYVCKYGNAYEVLIFVRYADSKSENNNDQISSCGALQPPRTNAGQISVCPLFVLSHQQIYIFILICFTLVFSFWGVLLGCGSVNSL